MARSDVKRSMPEVSPELVDRIAAAVVADLRGGLEAELRQASEDWEKRTLEVAQLGLQLAAVVAYEPGSERIREVKVHLFSALPAPPRRTRKKPK